MIETLFPFFMFATLFGVLMLGYPVAFSIGGTALLMGILGWGLDLFDPMFFQILPSRIFGLMQNVTLIAVPLFVFMGMVLSRSGIAESLLETLMLLFGKKKGGLSMAIIFVGALLAASTGIVGATVVLMTLIALPMMLQHKYCPQFSTGLIAASGTLGQIVPPSIVLILLSDVMSRPEVSTGKIFMAALVPSAMLIGCYMLYVGGVAIFQGKRIPVLSSKILDQYDGKTLLLRSLKVLVPPLLLIFFVLGSIFAGIATPTESAAVGAVGAVLIAALGGKNLKSVIGFASEETVKVTCMIMMILMAAGAFGLVFRGVGGDDVFREMFLNLQAPGMVILFLILAMIFVAGFFLDFIEITYIMVPVLIPVLVDGLGFDPLWVAILVALNLQTSFLTPPLGFSLFYLKGAAGNAVRTGQIYRGIVPFILLQLLVMALVVAFPALVTWLPGVMGR